MRYLAPTVTSFAANTISGARVNRHDFAKLIVGMCLTVLFAATVFGPLGFGLRYADQLDRRVRVALDARKLERIDAFVVREPALRRDVVVSGSADPDTQNAILAIVRDVPGVVDVRWSSSGGTTTAGKDAGQRTLSVHY
jgi:hypothetical protein